MAVPKEMMMGRTRPKSWLAAAALAVALVPQGAQATDPQPVAPGAADATPVAFTPVPALGIYLPRPKPEPGQPVEKARRTPGTPPRVEAPHPLAEQVRPGPAVDAHCPGNPDALGVSRVIEVDTSKPFIVGMQYRTKMPDLKPMEVILTFDDGPVPGNTERTLDALKAECVKATFFIVGRMAKAYPRILHRTAAEGHSIAYHTMTHPLNMVKWPLEKAKAEIEAGWRAVDRVVWGVESDWPQSRFFRYPGLFNSAAINDFLATKHLGVFAADATGNDWVRGYDAAKVLAFSLREIEARQGGILLLHDTKDSTSTMTRDLLRQMKAKGFKIVHMVQTPAPPPLAPLPGVAPADGVKPAAPVAALPGAQPPAMDQLRATFEAAARASEEAKKQIPQMPAAPAAAGVPVAPAVAGTPATTQSVNAAPATAPTTPDARPPATPASEEEGFMTQFWNGLGSLVGLR